MNHLITTLFALIFALNSTAQSPQKADSGHLDYYPDFKSELFRPCNITVWTPDDYSPEQGYAVLYMHDGQMLFDETSSWNHQTWNVDSIASAMQQRGLTRPFIVVGIDNSPRRLYEYIPRRPLDYLAETDSMLTIHPKKEFDDSDAYLAFIVNELKPFIDSRYSTLPDRENTFTMGSSCGGLISLYAICEYPEVFGGAGCLSTHIIMIPEDSLNSADQWSQSLLDYLADKMPKPNSCIIYMDHGDQWVDALYKIYQPKFDNLFRSRGWDESHFISRYYPGTTHSETDWQARLNIPLSLLLPSYK